MREPFGTTRDGERVERLTLANAELTVQLLTLGAILQDVRLAGVPHSLTLGTETLAPYEGKLATCGSIVGPVGNRISGAKTSFDGKTLEFEPNGAGGHTLHGGAAGTHRKLWHVVEAHPTRAQLRLELPAGDGGFPGNRTLSATFSLEGTALTLALEGETDAPTLLNLTNHSYWNLDGMDTTSGHLLRVDAAEVLDADETAMVTGTRLGVTETHFDFRTPRPLPNDPLHRLDTNYCLADRPRALTPVAELTGGNGVVMTLETTAPGLQVYDGAGLGGPGWAGKPMQPYQGLALEAQYWPDAPNQPSFPSIRLDPGQTWTTTTRWRFHQSKA